MNKENFEKSGIRSAVGQGEKVRRLSDRRQNRPEVRGRVR